MGREFSGETLTGVSPVKGVGGPVSVTDVGATMGTSVGTATVAATVGWIMGVGSSARAVTGKEQSTARRLAVRHTIAFILLTPPARRITDWSIAAVDRPAVRD
jgi:hypothetical protein